MSDSMSPPCQPELGGGCLDRHIFSLFYMFMNFRSHDQKSLHDKKHVYLHDKKHVYLNNDMQIVMTA